MDTEKRYGILLTAFGPGTRQGQDALHAFEQKARKNFPDIPIRWAFSSELVRTRLAAVRAKSDSIEKALQKLLFEKFTHIAVQPLQLIPGTEHQDIVTAVQAINNPAVTIEIGKPLLASKEIVEKVAKTLLAIVPAARMPNDVVLYMGHGSSHTAGQVYHDLHKVLQEHDPHVHVGSLEGKHNFDAVLARLLSKEERQAKGRVWLLPLFSVIGKHALQDMAGAKPSSWCSRLEKAGFSCETVLEGLVEHDAVATIWLQHLQQVMRSLKQRVVEQ